MFGTQRTLTRWSHFVSKILWTPSWNWRSEAKEWIQRRIRKLHCIDRFYWWSSNDNCLALDKENYEENISFFAVNRSDKTMTPVIKSTNTRTYEPSRCRWNNLVFATVHYNDCSHRRTLICSMKSFEINESTIFRGSMFSLLFVIPPDKWRILGVIALLWPVLNQNHHYQILLFQRRIIERNRPNKVHTEYVFEFHLNARHLTALIFSETSSNLSSKYQNNCLIFRWKCGPNHTHVCLQQLGITTQSHFRSIFSSFLCYKNLVFLCKCLCVTVQMPIFVFR